MSTNTDCLVLCLEEYDSEEQEIDTKLFVFYDPQTELFEIRGKRSNDDKIQRNSYSFSCGNKKSLIDLIELIIDSENECIITFYNFHSLPDSSYDITFDLLKGSENRSSEIVAYENFDLTNRKKMKKLVRILETVYNEY